MIVRLRTNMKDIELVLVYIFIFAKNISTYVQEKKCIFYHEQYSNMYRKKSVFLITTTQLQSCEFNYNYRRGSLTTITERGIM